MEWIFLLPGKWNKRAILEYHHSEGFTLDLMLQKTLRWTWFVSKNPLPKVSILICPHIPKNKTRRQKASVSASCLLPKVSLTAGSHGSTVAEMVPLQVHFLSDDLAINQSNLSISWVYYGILWPPWPTFWDNVLTPPNKMVHEMVFLGSWHWVYHITITHIARRGRIFGLWPQPKNVILR